MINMSENGIRKLAREMLDFKDTKSQVRLDLNNNIKRRFRYVRY